MAESALITGASSGIGEAIARLMAADKIDLVLVARRTGKLTRLGEELEKEYDIHAHIISSDLTKPGSDLELYNQVTDLGIRIDYLINNAGFGDYGLFTETEWERDHEMMMLNMVTLAGLAKRFGYDMVHRGKGSILNVSSTAAFQPGPYMAIYYATKAFVQSFSEALSEELRNSGVTVTALCPGPTATEFQKVAGIGNITLFNTPFLHSADEVAIYGYKAMKRGKRIAIHGALNKFLAIAGRAVPRNWQTYMVRKVQESRL